VAPTTTSSTTTTLAATCETIPDGPTFASIECRLAALDDRVLAEDRLGDFQSKLQDKLDQVLQRTAEAIDACRDVNVARARTRLKQVAKGLAAYRHRLAGRAARRKLDPGVRANFVDAGGAIKTDVQTLRGAVRCPDDAPSS
jgi:hypothetical protein